MRATENIIVCFVIVRELLLDINEAEERPVTYDTLFSALSIAPAPILAAASALMLNFLLSTGSLRGAPRAAACDKLVSHSARLFVCTVDSKRCPCYRAATHSSSSTGWLLIVWL